MNERKISMEQDRKGRGESFRFGRAVQGVANRFRRLGDENLAKHGITVSQLRVIAYISTSPEGEVFQRELEDAFEIRRSSVTGILQNMEKSGLIERFGAAGDARIKKIRLTERGRGLDRELKSFIHGLEEKLLIGFSAEEKAQAKDLLLRMMDNLEQIERDSL